MPTPRPIRLPLVVRRGHQPVRGHVFDDALAAFISLAGALDSGGRLAFVCWQDLFSNPFVAVPGLAIAQHIEMLDLGPPDAPGRLALTDSLRIRSLLTDAGLVDAVLEALAEEILLGGGGTLTEAVEFLREGGMGRAVLAGADQAIQEQTGAAVESALAP